jgi:hypothetical protein
LAAGVEASTSIPTRAARNSGYSAQSFSQEKSPCSQCG